MSLFIVIAVENHYMQKIRYQNLSECITKWYCVSCSDSLSSSPSSKECFYPNNILKMVVQFSFIIRILNNFPHKHKRSLLQQLKLHQNHFVVYLTVYFFYTSISPFGYKRSFFESKYDCRTSETQLYLFQLFTICTLLAFLLSTVHKLSHTFVRFLRSQMRFLLFT